MVPSKEIPTMSKSIETLLKDWLYGRMQHHCSASSVHLRGRDLFSFGSHYLAARRGEGYILLNSYNYSMRTSAQLSKIRGFLRRECYDNRKILVFDSTLDCDPPWWVCNDKPPLGHVLGGLLLHSPMPDPVSLKLVSGIYDVPILEDGTVPAEMWGGDVAELQDRLLGRGEGSAVATLHNIVQALGVTSAAAWVEQQHLLGRKVKETLAFLLADRYGSLTVPRGSFSGYKGQFWRKIMEVPEALRAEAAAELILRPSLKAHAEAFLNSYNNAQHRRSAP